jgi:hypothetical protein
MQTVKRGIKTNSVIRALKTFFIDNHMLIFALPILIATIAYSRFSRENEFRDASVVEGLIVSCKPGGDQGPCIADIEFRMGEGRVKKRSVRLQKSANCMVGQTVKVQYSLRSKQVAIIE